MLSDARRVLLMVALIGGTALVAGCREDEQGRILLEEKGAYQGPVDQGLTDQQIEALRLRAQGQRI